MIRVLSYNLLKNSAFGEIEGLVTDHDVDVLCLQEVANTSVVPELGGLVLADATRRNRLGLAVYHRPDRFDALDSRAYELKKSLHDHVFSPNHERLVGVRLHDRHHAQDVVMASFHAAPLSALNSLRRKQIEAAHGLLEDLAGGSPVLMVGDYNYPLFHRGLARKVLSTGFELNLSDKRTYSNYRVVRGHFDFVTCQGISIESVSTLDQGSSDHHPILVSARYRADD